MLLLLIYFLVLTIPLASQHLSTILITDLLFIKSLLYDIIGINGGLLQTTLLSQNPNILGSLYFISEVEEPNILLLLIPIANYTNDVTFKTWLIKNNPAKTYINSAESKDNIYKDNKGLSGIYLWLNTINDKYYIGSAKDLRNRLGRYYSPKELASSNNLIHRAIIKYKHQNFSLFILEYCNLEDLITREQFYLDNLTPPYNILTVAGNSTGFKHSGETKELMSKIKIEDPESFERIKELSNLNKGKQMSEEFKALRSFLTKGENNPMFGKAHTSKSRDLMSKAQNNINRSGENNPMFGKTGNKHSPRPALS